MLRPSWSYLGDALLLTVLIISRNSEGIYLSGVTFSSGVTTQSRHEEMGI